MPEENQFRESIKKMFEHTEDLSEPQIGKNIYTYQMCPKFVMRQSGVPMPLGCYYCKYGKFSYHEPAGPQQKGTCHYPDVVSP